VFFSPKDGENVVEGQMRGARSERENPTSASEKPYSAAQRAPP
jgi:hypothetical protein